MIKQLNEQVGWQDLKDLFRQAGDVIRADVHTDSDGNPKGSGNVIFSSPEAAQIAVGKSESRGLGYRSKDLLYTIQVCLIKPN